MAAVGFEVDYETGNIHMNQGDTGAFWVRCTRESGEAWPETARMLFTVRNPQGEIVMQRIYRPDDQWGAGDGMMLIEFHNSDTDEWEEGDYTQERRYDLAPVWEGTPPEGRCVDALRTDARMVEGAVVRTVFHGRLKIESVHGRI